MADKTMYIVDVWAAGQSKALHRAQLLSDTPQRALRAAVDGRRSDPKGAFPPGAYIGAVVTAQGNGWQSPDLYAFELRRVDTVELIFAEQIN